MLCIASSVELLTRLLRRLAEDHPYKDLPTPTVVRLVTMLVLSNFNLMCAPVSYRMCAPLVLMVGLIRVCVSLLIFVVMSMSMSTSRSTSASTSSSMSLCLSVSTSHFVIMS